MKNINQIAIYSLLFFSTTTNYGYSAAQFVSDVVKPVVHTGKKIKDYVGLHDAGKNALETLAKAEAIQAAGVELATASAQIATAAAAVPSTMGAIKQATDLAQQAGSLSDATNALNAATNNTQEAATALKEILVTTKNTATKLDLVIAASKEVTKLQMLFAAGAVVTIATGAVDFYHWGKSRLYPSNTEQLKDIATKDNLEILRTKKLLRASLALHAYQKRDQSGIPYACKESADKLFALGGGDELAEVIKQFQQHYGEQAAC